MLGDEFVELSQRHRIATPGGLPPRPAGADHAAGRQVARRTMAELRPGIGDVAAGDALGEVPRREHRAQRRRAGERVGEAVEPAGQDRRILDAAIQVAVLVGHIARADQHRATGGDA